MSYTLKYTGSEIDDILDRAVAGGEIDTELAGKQDTLTFDNVPTDGSNNPVKSGGVYDYLAALQIRASATPGAMASFSDGAAGMPVKSLAISIEPAQSGSGDPAPDNIRPISGWTGANITVAGENLCESVEDGTFDSSASKEANAVRARIGNFVTLKAGKTYVIKGTSRIGKIVQISYQFWTTNTFGGNTRISDSGWQDVPCSITPSSDTYCTFVIRYTDNSNISADDLSFIFVEIGNTINIDWTDEAGTVYGGTLNVTTGVLTVNYKMLEAQNITWTQYTGSVGFKDAEIVANKATTIFCSHYRSKNTVSGWTELSDGDIGKALSTNVIRIIDAAHDTDLAAWNAYVAAQKTANTPVQILISLNTPVTYQLTPVQVATLLGANNIWADCGEVTELTYIADPALYIQNAIGNGGGLMLSMSAPAISPSITPSIQHAEAVVDILSDEPEAEEPAEEAEEQTEEAEEE